MSCLYSSPEVTSVELLAVKLIALKLQALNCRHRCLVRSGMRLTRDLIAVQFDSTQIFVHTDFAVSSPSTKTRSPPAQRTPLAASSHSACQNKHRFLPWLFKRNIRLSFALRSSRAGNQSHRAPSRPAVWDPSTRAGLSL